MLVVIGHPDKELPSSTESEQRSLIHFLYEKHQAFDLGCNPTETFLCPRDELKLFKLVTRDVANFECSSHTSDPLTQWIEVCRYRSTYPTQFINSAQNLLAKKVEDCLHSYNMFDRITLLQRIMQVFVDHLDVRRTLLEASYVIYPRLDWFEYLVTGLITGNDFPKVHFVDLSYGTNERSFFYWMRSTWFPTYHYGKCTISDVIQSYLGLAVNLKDSIRLLRILNQPYRSLDAQTFAILRRLSEKNNLSIVQEVLSFASLSQLSGSSYAPTNDHPLQPWSTGLVDLANAIVKCQDALSGIADDAFLTIRSADEEMSAVDACESVKNCVLAVVRLLTKPTGLSRSTTPPEGSDSVPLYQPDIKRVSSILIQHLAYLVSSEQAEAICRDTPGRSMLLGGSLCGRAASKLVRLFLVTEPERSKQPPSQFVVAQTNGFNSPPSHTVSRSSSISITPSHRESLIHTPTTDGRDEKLLEIFTTPQTFSTDIVPDEEEEKENRVLDIVPELFEENSMPVRPVFSRYQSDIDWADPNPSPIQRYRRPRLEITEFDTNSLPAWPSSTVVSRTSTSVKLRPSPSKPTEIPFPEKCDQARSAEQIPTKMARTAERSMNSGVRLPRRASETKRPSSKISRSKHTFRVTAGQRTLSDFFSTH